MIPSSKTAIPHAVVTDAMIIMTLNYSSRIWMKMGIPFKSGQVVFFILLGHKKCFSCYAYRQDTDEEINNTTTYPDKDDFLMACPRFANQGCFKSEYTFNPSFPLPGFKNAFGKGCSMYELGDVEPDCRDLNLLGGMCRGKFSVLNLASL